MKCWDCGERTGTVAAIDDHRQESWREFSTFSDVERCPYAPFTEPAGAWAHADDARLRRLALARRPIGQTRDIKRLCVRCANRWRPFMKRDDQPLKSTTWTPAW